MPQKRRVTEVEMLDKRKKRFKHDTVYIYPVVECTHLKHMLVNLDSFPNKIIWNHHLYTHIHICIYRIDVAPPLPLVLVYHGPLLFATELGSGVVAPSTFTTVVQIISCLKLSYMACFSNDIQFADACFCHFSEMCKHIFLGRIFWPKTAFIFCKQRTWIWIGYA